MEHVLQQASDFRDENDRQPYRNLDFQLISPYDVLPSQKSDTYPFAVKDGVAKNILRPDLAAKTFLRRLTTIQTRCRVTDDDAGVIEDVASRSAGALRSRRQVRCFRQEHLSRPCAAQLPGESEPDVTGCFRSVSFRWTGPHH